MDCVWFLLGSSRPTFESVFHSRIWQSYDCAMPPKLTKLFLDPLSKSRWFLPELGTFPNKPGDLSKEAVCGLRSVSSVERNRQEEVRSSCLMSPAGPRLPLRLDLLMEFQQRNEIETYVVVPARSVLVIFFQKHLNLARRGQKLLHLLYLYLCRCRPAQTTTRHDLG